MRAARSRLRRRVKPRRPRLRRTERTRQAAGHYPRPLPDRVDKRAVLPARPYQYPVAVHCPLAWFVTRCAQRLTRVRSRRSCARRRLSRPRRSSVGSAAPAFSAADLLALLEGAGNAAVCRLLSRLPSGRGARAAAGRTLACLIDRLAAAYSAKYHADIVATLQGELSGGELQYAECLLRRGPSPGMTAVSQEAEFMVGQQSTGRDRVQDQAMRSRRGRAPPLRERLLRSP